MWPFLLEWSRVITYPSAPQLGLPERLILMHHAAVCHSQFHRFLWFSKSSLTPKCRNSSSGCALPCLGFLHRVFVPWAALSFALHRPFQHDCPSAGITALNPAGPWYLPLPCHFAQLSASQAWVKSDRRWLFLHSSHKFYKYLLSIDWVGYLCQLLGREWGNLSLPP